MSFPEVLEKESPINRIKREKRIIMI